MSVEGVRKRTPGRSQGIPAAGPVPESAFSNRGILQMASKVSTPLDPEEKEADSTARSVMRMHIPHSGVEYVQRDGSGAFRKIRRRDDSASRGLRSPYVARFAGRIARSDVPNEEDVKLQRQPNREEEERELHRQPVEEERDGNLQRKPREEEEKDKLLQRKPEEEEEKDKHLQRTPAEVEKDKHLQRQPAEEEKDKHLQRQPAEEEKDKHLQRQPADEEQRVIQRRAAPDEETLARKAEGTPDVSGNVSAAIRSSMSGGEPLPLSVREFMEPRFNADFSGVRIHNDDTAAKLNRQVSARAFAVDNHIFFGRDQFRPDTGGGRELIAHELTHTIQQGGAVQRNEANSPDDEETLQRGEELAAVTQRADTRVSRLGISDALDYFADRAYNIPGYRLLTIVLGLNPINMSRANRSAANILRAIVEFLPGGNLVTRALDNHGVFERAGAWVERQIATLGLTFSAIRHALDRFLDSLHWSDIFHLGGVWDRAKRIFTEPIARIKALATSIYTGIVAIIKEVILRPLAVLASRTPFWNLLIAVLGFNPITGDPVPRNADTLIGGFMTMIGQQEVWNNIKRANAVARAWAWFQGALAGLMGFVSRIPTVFMRVFRSLGIRDLLDVPGAFARVAGIFGGFVGRFMSWAGGTVMQLLQIIFEVVAPGVIPYIRRAAGAFRSIIRNPIGFLGNLVRAGKLGFRRFLTNFVDHLKASLINWLTGTMAGAGVYIPAAFTLREILKFVLSVLGLTWQNIRAKLVRAVGEPAVRAMESGFELIRTLITEGPAAAWQQLLEGLSNLKDMVIEQIITFVRNRIVVQAITRLLSMLSPVGAFVQAIIGIYNTIMFFVERLRTIAQVAMSFVNSIAAIAAGRLGAAAARVEHTMAGLLTLVISFLARFAGLGRVADAIKGLIDRVRSPIDRGLDRIVAWIVAQARRAGRFVVQAGVPQDPGERLRLGMARAVAVVNRLPAGGLGERVIAGALAVIRTRYAFTSLTPFKQGDRWWIRGEINPVSARATDQDTGKATEISMRQGQTIKVKYLSGMWVATITRIAARSVSYRFADARKGNRTTPRSEFQRMISAGDAQTYEVGGASRRDRYMGPNPPRGGSFDQQVLSRYRLRVTRRYVPETASDLSSARVRFPKASSGNWFTLGECDLSHEPVDAVTFWNSLQGAEKAPRSPVVRAFMTNPLNYIFEPSSLNRSRASRNNERYSEPHVAEG